MKLIIIFIITFFLGETSFSQKFNYIELESRVSKSYEKLIYRPQINVYYENFPENKRKGFYYFGLINNNWGEFYGGIALKCFKNTIVEFGTGLENNPSPLRFNMSIFYKKKRIAFTQIYEYGGSGFWYNINFSYKFNYQSQIGLILRRYNGEGIFFTYKLKNQPIVFYFAPLYDFELKTFRFLSTIRYLIF